MHRAKGLTSEINGDPEMLNAHYDTEESKLVGSTVGGAPTSPEIVDNEIEKIGVGNFQYTRALILGIGNAADAVEITAMGYILTVYKNSDGTVTDYDKELLSASVFVGMLIGGLVFGRMSDRIGRRPCLIYAMLINAAAGVTSSLAVNTTMLALCRVIAGFGIGGTIPSVFTLCAEFSPHNRRGFFIAVVASFWMVGAILTAGLAWVLLGSFENNPDVSWRPFAFFCAIPAATCLILSVLYVPESPRFLVLKERHEDAAGVLRIMASSNRVYAYDIHSKALRGSALSRLDEDPPLKALFEPTLRRATVLLMIVWFMLSFGSYGVSTWITELFTKVGLTNAYQNAFIYSSANLPGNIFSMAFMDRLGRKTMLAWSMLLAAASALLFAFATHKGAEYIVPAAFLFNMFSIPAWNALDALSAECFPTSLRTSAMGILASSGRIGSMIAQFVNGGLSSHIAILLMTTSTTMLIGAGSTCLLPTEPAGRRLDDIVHV